jgi:hypothetical protein
MFPDGKNIVNKFNVEQVMFTLTDGRSPLRFSRPRGYRNHDVYRGQRHWYA